MTRFRLQLLVAADFLCVLGVRDMCCGFLNTNMAPDNCIGILNFAR